jgi:hypothetical protein
MKNDNTLLYAVIGLALLFIFIVYAAINSPPPTPEEAKLIFNSWRWVVGCKSLILLEWIW